MAQTETKFALVNSSLEQNDQQNVENGSEWRGALSQEAYERREKFLMTQGIAANNGLQQWALVDAQKPDALHIFAGCESLRKKALVSRNGKVEEVPAYGICSVFTPVKQRGKKYASEMIRMLGEKLPQVEQGCLFSVLYSDIGKKFYARNSWKPFPSSHVALPPERAEHLADSLDSVLSPLRAADLPALCEADAALVRKRLEAHRGPTAVALIPDYETIKWHNAREDFVANELYKRVPETRGAIARVGGIRVWAIWTRMWYNTDLSQRKGNAMHILRLVVEDEAGSAHTGDVLAGMTAVLRMAQHEAYEWNMEQVELWNPGERVLQAARRISPEAQVVHREKESITSLRWYGDAKEEDDLLWMENEKYGWC